MAEFDQRDTFGDREVAPGGWSRLRKYSWRYHFVAPVTVDRQEHWFADTFQPPDESRDRLFKINVPRGSTEPVYVPWTNVSYVEKVYDDG